MNRSEQQVRNYVILALAIWFGIALLGGRLNILSPPGKPPVALGLFFALPFLFFGALYLANTRFHAFTHSISLRLITAAHLWRFVGAGFVLAVYWGKLPAGFGAPEGIGDVIAAAFALPLAQALHRNRPVRAYFTAWNVFGLVDLVSAITMGVLYSEGQFGLLRTDVSTRLMTAFPVSVIPTFFVPLFILLHVLALLRRGEVATPLRPSSSRAQQAAA